MLRSATETIVEVALGTKHQISLAVLNVQRVTILYSMLLPCYFFKIVSAHTYKLLKKIFMGKMIHLIRCGQLKLNINISNVLCTSGMSKGNPQL